MLFRSFSATESNQTLVVAENITVTQGLTCAPPATIDLGCVPPLPPSKLACGPEKLSSECIPAELESLTVYNLTAYNFTSVQMGVLNQTAFADVQSFTCAQDGAIDPGCISTVPTSKLQCDTKLGENCLDISMAACTAPINANCVDISGETCMAPLDASCVPEKNVQSVAVNDLQSTMSLLYVDVPSMTINVAATGRYLIFVNMQMSQTTSAASMYISLALNGAVQPLSERIVQLETNNMSIIHIQEFAPLLTAGDVVSVRWHKTGPGDISTTTRRLIVQQI